MKNLWIGAIAVLVIAGGYFAFRGKSAPETPDTIRIGVIAPLTGIAADYGAEMKAGIEAAGGTNITFIYEDDKCDPKEAVTAYKKLTEIDKVSLIVGPACGSPQEAIAPLLAGTDILVIVPSAASETLYETSGGNMYNMQYALEREAEFLAGQLYDGLGYEKIALVTYQNAFSKVLADSFKKAYRGEVKKEISFAGMTPDISSELLKLKGEGYDAIFSTDISFFFAQGTKKLAELGIKQPVFSSYAVELPALRPLVEGVGYSYPADMEENGKGAIWNLAKQSVELIVAEMRFCKGSISCAKTSIADGSAFDESGASIRKLVLKRITKGVPEEY